MCLEEGCYLGDPSEERVNQSTEKDFLTFFEAWILQCETFGEFARQSARNTLIYLYLRRAVLLLVWVAQSTGQCGCNDKGGLHIDFDTTTSTGSDDTST